MNIGGLLKFSSLDFPGKLSAVIFCQGCPLRCVYCHNPDFQSVSKVGAFSFDAVLDFLKRRVGLLDAVVISGGEPLVQPDLAEAFQKIRGLGFATGLHTSGVVYDVFDDVLPFVDWVGFDVKTSFENYEIVTKVRNSGEVAKRSLERLARSGVDFEVRTTFDKRFIDEDDLYKVAFDLRELGVRRWVLQECIIRRDLQEPLKIELPDEYVLDNIRGVVEVELRRE